MADNNVGTIYYEVDIKTDAALAAAQSVANTNAKMGRSFETVDKSSKKSGDALGGFGRKAGAAGIQIQQLVGQIQGGQSALVAISQQAADLGIVLGAPLAGAIAGITAAVAGPFITSLFNATHEVETLEDALKRLDQSFEVAADGSDILSKELIRLAQISREAVRLRLIVEAEDAQKQLAQARNQIVETFQEITGNQTLSALDKLEGITVFDKIADDIGVTADEARALADAIPDVAEKADPAAYDRLAGVVANLKEQYGSTNPNVNALSKGLQESNEDALEAANALARLRDVNKDLDMAISESNRKRTEAFKESLSNDDEGDLLSARLEQEKKYALLSISQQQKQFQDEQTLADKQLQERLAAIETARQQEVYIGQTYDQAEYEAKTLHAERLAEIEQKQTDEQQKQLQQRLQAQQVYINSMSQLGGQLTNLVSTIGAEQTALGKAVFLANQALAVANIIVSTQQAAAQANTLDLSGALAARVTAMGYASAAIAAGVAVGQTASGRQTGGPTEAGQMYRVGEAGPEMYKVGGRQYLIGGERGSVEPMQAGSGAGGLNLTVINNGPIRTEAEEDGNGGWTLTNFIADMDDRGPAYKAIIRNTSATSKTK